MKTKKLLVKVVITFFGKNGVNLEFYLSSLYLCTNTYIIVRESAGIRLNHPNSTYVLYMIYVRKLDILLKSSQSEMQFLKMDITHII